MRFNTVPFLAKFGQTFKREVKDESKRLVTVHRKEVVSHHLGAARSVYQCILAYWNILSLVFGEGERQKAEPLLQRNLQIEVLVKWVWLM